MRIAILSDIHGNLEAFESVLCDIGRQAVDRIVSLGDNIGYGPDSVAVVARLMALQIPSVLGNHELVVKSPKFINWFNPQAREAVQQTLKELTPRTQAYCRDLPRFLILNGARLVHGFPPRSPTLYLFQIRDRRLEAYFRAAQQALVFVGHTHLLNLVAFDGQKVNQTVLEQGRYPLESRSKYIVNAGSVGQPRDRDKRAKYVIWDLDDPHIEVRCVTYPVAQVIAKMAAKGYPPRYAQRLQ
ncbi:MAG: metallophosphoesterase family protein [Desulfobacterales bacterium]